MSKNKRNNNSNGYMDNIYNLINSPEEDYDDGIVYLDEPEDNEFEFYDDSLAWADDITYLDEPEDDEFDLELGDGFIPLPKGDNYEEELVVIDEDYVLDDYEKDLVDTINILDDEIEEMKEMLYEEETGAIDVEKAESIIRLPKNKTESETEELKVVPMDKEDDKISKAIAREYLENYKANNVLDIMSDDYENPDDDVAWVDDLDLFGNDIGVIIADDPCKEFEDDDYVNGSFADWLTANQ